ncbi:expressed unknown protein [Seminavis robusta]|uniref:BTB domain-containing protein n=1 Tax=Seminavis robusta TaxID=568900 RepID=A0A9N8DTF1_9STRA|nr:expressed unknown protein [Seminavis robusta]|eukprot:Sro267_g103390.1 n/a (309) ;mRNA; r:33368-34294
MSEEEDSNEGNNKSADPKEDNQAAVPERPGFAIKPDVVVVVGGIEFQESSYALRVWSEYFDAAFRSGMQESTTKRFEFPDKNPEDWKFIMSLLDPFSDAEITKQNVDVVLSWFDELCVTRGLKGCDNALYEMVKPTSSINSATELATIVKQLSKSLQFDLRKTKAKCLKLVCGVVKAKPLWLKKGQLEPALNLVIEYIDCREVLWGTLQIFLPSTITDPKEQDMLIRSGILQKCILAEVKIKQSNDAIGILKAAATKKDDDIRILKAGSKSRRDNLQNKIEVMRKCDNCRIHLTLSEKRGKKKRLLPF